MRILFICHNLTGGGAERVCVDLANGLSDLGHEVMILTDLNAPVTYKPNKKVELIDCVSSSNPILLRLKRTKQLLGLVNKRKPDIIVSILFQSAISAKIATLLTGKGKIIGSDHNAYQRPLYAPMKLVHKIQKFWLNYIFDAVTVLTQADIDFLNGRFRNVYVMPNPLTFTPLKDVPDNKEKVILAVGRMDAWHVKGFDLLIEAWKNLANDFPTWKLRIMGGGSEQSRMFLMNLAEGTESVEFVPYSENIVEVYKKAEIFVLSSRYEGFGLVLTEAMSQHCACIAADYKGRQSEIITDGVDGLICISENVNSIEDKLRMLLSDDVLRADLQMHSVDNLDRFSIENIALRWERLFRKLVN